MPKQKAKPKPKKPEVNKPQVKKPDVKKPEPKKPTPKKPAQKKPKPNKPQKGAEKMPAIIDPYENRILKKYERKALFTNKLGTRLRIGGVNFEPDETKYCIYNEANVTIEHWFNTSGHLKGDIIEE